MSVVARLDWVKRQIQMGVLNPGKVKVKITLQSALAGAIDPVVAVGVAAVLDGAQQLVSLHSKRPS